ncbi:MAG: PhnD/SsuA/transferrin family substrate-binding protein [Kofleriaceae bacterium]
MTRAILVLLALTGTARADNVTVGVFAPSAPFPSTAARVELASRLADHLGKALAGTGTGRVYGRAGDFASAVKKGEVQVALVDATFLASGGGGSYTVIASSVRGGEATGGWQLVARGSAKIADLKGKRVLVPSNGGRETDFVINVMLGGDLPREHFGKIEVATDTASALSALGLGKADAAVVPAGVDLPGGVAVVLALPAIANPTLVAYGNVTAAQRSTLATAAASFKGDSTITGFRGGDADAIRAIARRFTVPLKRGPLAVPAVRLVVGDLVESRTFTIERTPPAAFAVVPASR